MSETPKRKSEGRLEFVDVGTLIESPWNPNEMDQETFDALVEDMRVGGLYSIKPIDVFPVGLDDRGLVKLQTSDGHNRVRAAKQLGWKKIRAEVASMTEDEAKVLNYRRNRERGNMNPIKEAELFLADWEKGTGKLTQEQIAGKYGVSQSYVSRLIAGLPIYAVGIKPTHAEEVVQAVKEPEAQVAVARVTVAERLTPDQTREVAERVAKDVKAEPEAPVAVIQARAEEHAKEVKLGMKPHTDVSTSLAHLRSDATRAFGQLTSVFDGLTIDKKMEGVSQQEINALYDYLVDLLNGAIARLPGKYKAKVRAK